MNRIRQYIPNMFFNDLEPEIYEFNSLAELMNTPLLKRDIEWAKKNLKNVDSISYAVSLYGSQYELQCRYIEKGKDKSHVVGFLDNNTCLK